MELHLLASAPGVIVVHSHRIYKRDARLRSHHKLVAASLTATSARSRVYAQQIFEREVLTVDVVEESQYGQLLFIVERIEISSCQVFRVERGVVCFGLPAQARIELSELSVAHLLFGYEVDCLVAVAIVNAREFGLVAQLVKYLDLVDNLGRNGLDSHRYIFTEELVAINKYLLHLLSLHLDFTLFNHNTRHFREQFLGFGIFGCLEGVGVVYQGVGILRCAELNGLLHYDINLGGRLLHVDASQCDLFLVCRAFETLVGIADE